MTTVNPWRTRVEQELTELLASPESELDQEDAWHFCALVAHAQQYPSDACLASLAATAENTGRLKWALQNAAPYAAVDLLNALDVALVEAEEPAGKLADAILELDDYLSVKLLEGLGQHVGDVVAHAVALIDLSPDGPAALHDWAVRRLQTIRDGCEVRELWLAVQRSAAVAVAAHLPTVAVHSVRTADIERLMGPDKSWYVALVDPLPIRRAWAPVAAAEAVEWDEVEEGRICLFLDGDRLVVQVRRDDGPIGSLHLVVSTATVAEELRFEPTKRTPESVWFDLGSEAELAQQLSSLRQDSRFSDSDAVRLRLEYRSDDQ